MYVYEGTYVQYVCMHVGVYAGVSSHRSCKPVDEHPTALRGPHCWGDTSGVPAANGATSIVASF